MQTTDTVKVISGHIQARMEVTDIGVIFHAPIQFKGEIVASEGSWPHVINASNMIEIAQALQLSYIAAMRSVTDRKQTYEPLPAGR